MEKFHNSVAEIMESLFFNQSSTINFLSFVGDHNKELEAECLAIIFTKDKFYDTSEWFSYVHSFAFKSIPYDTMNEYFEASMVSKSNH